MAEIKNMADQAKNLGQEFQNQAHRIGREFQEQAVKAGEEYQKAAHKGFEAANQSATEINRGFQSIAAELTDYSKKTLEDLFQIWEQLLRARSMTEVVEVQTRYAQKAYETHLSKMAKLTELYNDLTRKAIKPDN